MMMNMILIELQCGRMLQYKNYDTAYFDISVGFADSSSARVHTRTPAETQGWCFKQCRES